MKAVVQRVSQSSVRVADQVLGAIGPGLMVLLGIAHPDTEADAEYLAEKIVHLRIFEDNAGKMNQSLKDTAGGMLVVSQFTLLADCRKGRRPSFVAAAPPEHAQGLYQHFVEHVRAMGVETATGQFGAMMQVALVNDGPVTVIIESKN